jgi:hypothetical protein
MANQDSPFGFRWLGLNGGSASATDSLITRAIASANNEAIGWGDPVMDLTTGYIQQWNSGQDAHRLVGIFNGCEYFSTSQQRKVWSKYWPGSDATGDVQASIVPIQLSVPPKFVVQVATTPLTIADIGSNHDVTIGTVNTVTGMSGASLTSAGAATATLPFTVVDLWSNYGASSSIGTDNTANFNWVIVAANAYQITGLA